MKHYLKLLEEIKSKGTWKDPAREGMPRTLSLFGYRFRHDLSDGFPLLTTKELSFKNIVTELLWFLKGDTNIKYLVDNGCNIWNEDAYNYYCKVFNDQSVGKEHLIDFDGFVSIIKNSPNLESLKSDVIKCYFYGDCGIQYGKLWRSWEGLFGNDGFGQIYIIDQIKDLIGTLKNNPMSRRHIITAWNPATLDDMALNACHTFVQFNCRPIDSDKRTKIANEKFNGLLLQDQDNLVAKYYLDCQMYQRSADVFLGVPYNIASYSLLTHIIAKICNMIPGEFIHTFGDAHIYENHLEQVNIQLNRSPKKLPELVFKDEFHYAMENRINSPLDIIEKMQPNWFKLNNYQHDPKILGKLSTGLK